MGFLGFGRKANEVVVKREDLVRVQSMMAVLAERTGTLGDKTSEAIAERALTSLIKMDTAVDMLDAPVCSRNLRGVARKYISASTRTSYYTPPRPEFFNANGNSVLNLYSIGAFGGWFDDIQLVHPNIVFDESFQSFPAFAEAEIVPLATGWPSVAEIAQNVAEGASDLAADVEAGAVALAEGLEDAAIDLMEHVSVAADELPHHIVDATGVLQERIVDAVTTTEETLVSAVEDGEKGLVEAVQEFWSPHSHTTEVPLEAPDNSPAPSYDPAPVYEAPVSSPEPSPVYEAPAPSYEAPAYEAPSSYDSGGSSYDSGSSGGGGDW